MSSKYRVTKGFKFHARSQTGAYSCWLYSCPICKIHLIFIGSFSFIINCYTVSLLQFLNPNFVQKFALQILLCRKFQINNQIYAGKIGPSQPSLYGKYCQKAFVSYGNNKTSQICIKKRIINKYMKLAISWGLPFREANTRKGTIFSF